MRGTQILKKKKNSGDGVTTLNAINATELYT